MKPFLHNMRCWLQKLNIYQSIKPIEIVIFIRQLTTLISASIPIIQSFDMLAACQPNLQLRLLIYTLKRDLLSGKNLSYCFQSHPKYFDELICRLICIGEQSGKLHTMLLTVTHYYEKNNAFKQRIKQALFYPCIIAIAATLMMTGMLLLVIPRFADLFQDISEQLPVLTRCIFYVSKLLREKLSWIVLGLISCTFLLFTRRQAFYCFIKKAAIKLPFSRTVLYKMTLARFTHHFALTVSAGIPVPQALLLTAHASQDRHFTHLVMKLHGKITAGISLHQAMHMLMHFPILLVQMVKIGEESGMLETMLNHFTMLTETEIDRVLQRLNLLLEPLIMLVLGVLIGGLVIGMYLPIFKLGNAI